MQINVPVPLHTVHDKSELSQGFKGSRFKERERESERERATDYQVEGPVTQDNF